jgi:hypothetical protein
MLLVGSQLAAPAAVHGRLSDRAVDHAARPIDRAWASIPVLLPALIALVGKMGSIDLAYHLRAGDEIRAAGALLHADTWTFSVNGAAWTDQQWGAQLLLSFFYSAGGWASIAVAWAALSGATMGLVYLACRARGASIRSASILTLGGYLVAQPALGMRPQLFALPLFAAALWAVAGRHQHPGRLWLLPVASALTASLHGSFVLYPVLGGIAWIEDLARHDPRARRTLLITGLTAVSTLLNPYGFAVWVYVYKLATNPVIRDSITEWAPTTLSDIGGAIVFASFLAVAVFLIRRKDATPWTDLLTLGVFLALALSAQRAIVWWGLVAPVVVSGLLPPTKEQEGRRGSAIPAYGLIAALVVAILLLLPWWRHAGAEQLLAEAPPGLTAAVDRLPAGTRLVAHQPWGSWIEFAVRDVPVFVDSRIELVPEDIWDDYGQLGFSGARWRGVLDRWGVQAILAKADDWDLIPILRRDPGWRVDYEDEDGVLFVRAA